MAKNKKAFQAVIVQRFMDDKAYKNFLAEYNDHRYSGGRSTRVVNDTDLKILYEHKKGVGIRELARTYKKGITAIQTSIRMAALSKLK